MMDEHNERNVITAENCEPEPEEIEAVMLAAAAALKYEHAQERYAEIMLTDDETIHAYNLEYRNIDRPTDVLSFPADEGEDLLAPPDGYLGDIMISLPRAAVQGAELGHSTKRELAFLTVHGMLHLLGYDHMEPDDESVMLEHQRAIMSDKALCGL